MSSRSTALRALAVAAANWRARETFATPLAQRRTELLAWMEARPDQLPPLELATAELSHRQPGGRPVLLPDGRLQWVKPSPWAGTVLLAPPPVEPRLVALNPVLLLWSDDLSTRRMNAGRVAVLQAAAHGLARELASMLRDFHHPAAAELVQQRCDPDGFYELAAGGLPRPAPSPARLLRTVLPPELWQLVEVFADGGLDWDPGPQPWPIPKGHARLPGEPQPSIDWITKA